MDQQIIDALDAHGWAVDCESPLELSKEVDGVIVGWAGGEAADLVIDYVMTEEYGEGWDDEDEDED